MSYALADGFVQDVQTEAQQHPWWWYAIMIGIVGGSFYLLFRPTRGVR